MVIGTAALEICQKHYSFYINQITTQDSHSYLTINFITLSMRNNSEKKAGNIKVIYQHISNIG
jgi:hypothetical protein